MQTTREETTLHDEPILIPVVSKELLRWKNENRQAFESYNEMIEKHGLFSDQMGLL